MLDVLLGTGVVRRAFGEHCLHGLEERHIVADAKCLAVWHASANACDSSRTALQRESATLSAAKDDAGCRIAGAPVSIADLPAGDYFAGAVISIGNRRVGQVTRPFRIAHEPATGK